MYVHCYYFLGKIQFTGIAWLCVCVDQRSFLCPSIRHSSNWTKQHMCHFSSISHLFFISICSHLLFFFCFSRFPRRCCFRSVTKRIHCWLSVFFFPFLSFFVTIAFCLVARIWYRKSVATFNINVVPPVTFDSKPTKEEEKYKKKRNYFDHKSIIRMQFSAYAFCAVLTFSSANFPFHFRLAVSFSFSFLWRKNDGTFVVNGKSIFLFSFESENFRKLKTFSKKYIQNECVRLSGFVTLKFSRQRSTPNAFCSSRINRNNCIIEFVRCVWLLIDEYGFNQNDECRIVID